MSAMEDLYNIAGMAGDYNFMEKTGLKDVWLSFRLW